VRTRYYSPIQTNLPGIPFDLSYSWHFRSKAEQVVSNCTIILLQRDLQSLQATAAKVRVNILLHKHLNTMKTGNMRHRARALQEYDY